MKRFFTSDSHFGHRNIIKYSNRVDPETGQQFDLTPQGVEKMDETMISIWNSIVRPNDEVYHLGDFSMGRTAVPNIVRRLNGNIHLVWGNHDSDQVRSLECWASSQPYLEIKEQGQHLVLCHYSMRVWNRSHHGAIMLYGHSHGSLPGNNQSLDVGVDCWGYKPVSLDEIKGRLSTLPPYRAVDHHGM